MNTQAVRQDGPDVLVRVLVVPNASADEIVGVHGDRIRIRVVTPPERGRANAAVCNLIREAIGARRVEVVGGATSRNKTVCVFDVSMRDVSPLIGSEA